MKISVIIAVYNADKFVTQAVESALAQPETAEVILVEDGSTDNSLVVCQMLEKTHNKVQLLQHLGGINKGAPASFNLGMQRAKYEYLTILGADDFYLPGRFNAVREVFVKEPACDGVYEAMGIHFENEVGRQRWLNSPMAKVDLTTMTKVVTPEKLFGQLVRGTAGHFSLCGLVIKKSALAKVGFMNESLRLHQDTDFIYRLAVAGKLLPGELDQPVVIRRVHVQNRISAPRSEHQIYHERILQYKATYDWLRKNGYKKQSIIFLTRKVRYCVTHKPLPYSWMVNLRKLLHDGLKKFYN